MDNVKRCCKKRWWRCGVGVEDEEVRIEKALVGFLEVPTEDEITQLLADVEEITENGGDAKKVPMSEQVQCYASYLQTHLNKVVLGAQVSRDAFNALGNTHLVGIGLTIIAVGLNMALKTNENKDQCNIIMKESLDIWRKDMKPILGTEGLPRDLMVESIGIIIEGYLYCKNLLDSRGWKRFICANCQENELGMWKKMQMDFLVKASAVMNADLIVKHSQTPPTICKTYATTLVGLEGRKRAVMKLLDLEDKEKARIVVLHGMGGIGKSTLADVVYKEASISKERRRCRIELGETPSKEHITSVQRQMVEDLTGKSLNRTDPHGIRDRLRQVLLSETGRPVFIFIDNVLQSEDLEGLLAVDCEKITLPKGSRLLVTTRDVSVYTRIFQRMEDFEVKEFSVKLLNDADAKTLFFVHAFGQEEVSAEVLETYDDGQGLINMMVSSICGNLPLALKVLGRSLFNTKVHSWRKKHRELMVYGKFEEDQKIRNVVQSSYDTLNPETQTAFLIACVCFCDSWYRGFHDVVETVLPKATLRRLRELCLLERRSIEVEKILRGNKRQVVPVLKMHDLVRNMGYEMAVARKCAPAKMLKCKQDFLDLSDESWSEMKWLRVPHLEDGIDAQLLEKCKDLEILHCSTQINGHIRKPPPHLKALHCTISSLPLELDELEGNLVYLEVGVPIQEFPVSPSTRKLQCLKNFGGASIPKKAIDCHKNMLQKLLCRETVELSTYFCVEMAKLQWLMLEDFKGESLPNEMGRLASLELLFVASSTIRELPPSLAELKRLQFLLLTLENLKELPSGMLMGMKELAFLKLWNRNMIFRMQDIRQLAYLEVLQLSVERLTEDSMDGSVLKLQSLKVFWLGIESTSSLEGVRWSCPSLQCLNLSLGRVQVLPSNFITASTNLRSLRLLNCLCLQELSYTETEMLWAVESLVITNCPALKGIPEGMMKRVESLALVDCPGVRELPADLDEQKAGSMCLLLCDSHLLPPQFLLLPPVAPFSRDDVSSEQQLQSFVMECFFPASLWLHYS